MRDHPLSFLLLLSLLHPQPPRREPSDLCPAPAHPPTDAWMSPTSRRRSVRYPACAARPGRVTTWLLALTGASILIAPLAMAQSPYAPPPRESAGQSAERPNPFGDADRWVPSLSLTLGFSFHTVEGEVSSQDLTAGEPLRSNAGSDKVSRSPIGGGRLGLLSPSLPIPLRPRLFFEGEIAAVSNQKRRVAREGTPEGITLPPFNPDQPGNISDVLITGVGSVTNADIKNRQYGAAAGLFIPFRIGDWDLAVKPGARYLRRTMEFDGRVIAARRPDPSAPPEEGTQRIFLSGDEDLDIDAIGPSLELEIDVARWWDNVGASLFFGGGAYRILGDRDVSFSDTTIVPNPVTGAPETFRATFSSEVDPWIFHGSVGLRVRWQGFRPGWFGNGERKAENGWRNRRSRSRSSR